MEWEREMAIKFRDGKEEGIKQKAEEDAIALLNEGDSPEKISRCLKLPIEKVLILEKWNIKEIGDNNLMNKIKKEGF